MKKIGIGLIIILCTGLLTFFTIKIPSTIENNKVERMKIAKTYDTKVYESWGLAYIALTELEDTFYDELDKSSEEKKKEYEIKKYPEKSFSTLVEEFGIAVQKPYSGNYVFEKQKGDLLSYLDKELKNINTAINNYKAVNPEDPNALDANVLQALKEYNILLSKIKSNIEHTTLEETKNKPIGDIIKKGLKDEDFSKPLIYGKIGVDYILKNLNYHKANYDKAVDQDVEIKDKIEIIFKTQK